LQIAKTDALVATLVDAVPPVEPSEAEQREVFDALTYQGQLVSQSAPFDQVRSLLGQARIGRELAVRALFNSAVSKYHLTVNPRYVPLVYHLNVPVTAPSGAVAMSVLAIRVGPESVVPERV